MWENRRDPRSGEYATEISPAVSLEMSWMILYVSFFISIMRWAVAR